MSDKIFFFDFVSQQSNPVTAVIELNPPSWFDQEDYADPAAWQAPLPVFLDGWKSSSSAGDILSWEWDLGDGTTTKGMNTGHVYETPGTYNVSLRVTDRAGNVGIDTFTITVLARTGTTYYVAPTGDDTTGDGSFDTPWRSADKVFAFLAGGTLNPGDRVLFERGGTYVFGNLIQPQVTGYGDNWGYYFGAYGSGDKPIIDMSGASGGSRLSLEYKGLAFVGFQDLDIRGGKTNSFFKTSYDSGFLWLKRCDFTENLTCIDINSDLGQADREVSNVVIEQCRGGHLRTTDWAVDDDYDLYASLSVAIFARGQRIALMGNSFEYSGNHVAYTHLNVGIVYGNIFRYPAFSRTAFRLSGRDTTQWVGVEQNTFFGGIDPHTAATNPYTGDDVHSDGGDRYCFRLVELAPNTSGAQSIENVRFQNNDLGDAEILLLLSAVSDTLIRSNTFLTDDESLSTYGRIEFGTLYNTKPLVRVRFEHNDIESCEDRGGQGSPIFVVKRYGGGAWNGISVHTDLEIKSNQINVLNSPTVRLLQFWHSDQTEAAAADYSAYIAQVDSDSNNLTGPSGIETADLFRLGGGMQSGGFNYDLAEWKAFTAGLGTARDANTTVTAV